MISNFLQVVFLESRYQCFHGPEICSNVPFKRKRKVSSVTLNHRCAGKGVSPGLRRERPELWSKPCRSCAKHVCLLGTGLKETNNENLWVPFSALIHVHVTLKIINSSDGKTQS